VSTTRRDFIELAVLAGAAGVAMPSRTAAAGGDVGRADRPLKILVLGGTGLIGPPLVSYAVARGHEVTLFNRGKTNTELFPELERIIGDRNDDISALAAEVAKGRRWDVVIDNTASIPRWVEESAGLLKGSAAMYLYTSSISAYADASTPNADETAPLGTITSEEVAKVKTNRDITGENYGPLKALCEKAAQEAFPERCIVVRPGLIVGPGDSSDRFTYWPVRIHRGGEILAPGNPTDPVQFIDCRDLGEWYVRLVEDGAIGVYNGVGPASPMSIAEMLYGIRATTGGELSFTWVDAGFLKQHEVEEWQEVTVWVPPVGEYAGFSSSSIARAKAAGLTFRPLATTAVDTLAYWSSLADERRVKPRAGLDPEKERAVLAAWHSRTPSAQG
jgi:nucleoside-diphosphate-sugar epimerase